jgi:hypothetical protein
MKHALPIVVAFGVVLVSGVVHGLWTDRWLPSNELRAASDRLASLPLELSDWDANEEEMDPAEQSMAEIEAYRKIRFVNRTTKAEVQFLIVCGRPGPISVHTPNICYLGAGYAVAGMNKRTLELAAGGDPVEIQVGLFRKEEAGGPILQRTIWSFSTNGEWRVPDNARQAYARSRFLYKIYMARSLARADELVDKDPTLELLRSLLPRLQKHLFAPSPPV